MRVDRPSIIRVLVVVLGILVGMGAYSYGMFHRLLPARANLADVMNCGIPPGASYQAYDAQTLGQSDVPLCQVTPGRWTKTPYGNGPLFLGLAIAFGSVLAAIHRTLFLKWAASSARGTVTLFLVLFGVPMMLLGLHLNFVEGTLTLDWAFHVVFYTLFIGAVGGLLMWYTLVRPLRARATANNRWRGP
jgi:hypothetical protein